jgi:hypothetical protein
MVSGGICVQKPKQPNGNASYAESISMGMTSFDERQLQSLVSTPDCNKRLPLATVKNIQNQEQALVATVKPWL